MTYINENMIHFDSGDWKNNLALMDRADEFDSMMFGSNAEGEKQTVSINYENITLVTVQSNRWIRENIYWRDGTCEELYHGRVSKKEVADAGEQSA